MGWRDQCDVGLAEGDCKAEPVTHPETSGSRSQIGAAAESLPQKIAEADFHFWHSVMVPSELLILKPAKPLGVPPAGPAFPALFQSIYYNSSAASTITANSMGSPDALKKRLEDLTSGSRSLQDMRVVDFAPDAEIVKTFWEIVTPGDFPGHPEYHLAAGSDLFHEDMKPNADGTYSKTSPKFSTGNFTSFIDISEDAQKRGTCQRTTIDQDDGGNRGKFLVYTLGCFYSRKVDPDEVRTYAQRSIQDDITQPLLCNVPHGQYCYLILVGVHAMARETPNWVWMTYWWSSAWWAQHSGTTVVQDKWDLFEVNATVNNTDPVANPYLEGSTSGMQSNCMECHRHAVFHPDFGSPIGPNTSLPRYTAGIAGSDLRKPKPLSFANQPLPSNGVFEALPPGAIQSRLRDLQTPSCFFGEALQTHFLWTIALHASTLAPKDPCQPQQNKIDPAPLVK
jgi:hypothetical protein